MSIKKYTQAEFQFTFLITFIIFKKLLGATHDKANRLVVAAYSIRRVSGNRKWLDFLKAIGEIYRIRINLRQGKIVKQRR
jgi:hypothetical protein